MDELVALGTSELCCHCAQCSFHTAADAASVVVLGLVWVRVRVERHWLLKEGMAVCLPSWAGACALSFPFLHLEFSVGRWKHAFPALVPPLGAIQWAEMCRLPVRQGRELYF